MTAEVTKFTDNMQITQWSNKKVFGPIVHDADVSTPGTISFSICAAPVQELTSR